MVHARNVLGEELIPCCTKPMTGFFRTGACETGPDDHGRHVVCAVMTPEFLRFTVSIGNDLVTPQPEFGFPGLQAGDRWCLCAERWREAYEAGEAPPVLLSACHETALDFVSLEMLQEHALPEGGDFAG
ncbi:MAG: hypothetical protein CSA62_05630 [Planctomycetota bacterium]|nr:MAG: hypothetical protein CSA62_05630 [Planctomycetota bacterium]